MQKGKPMASSNLCILTGSLGHKTGSREGAPVCVCSHPIYVIFCISNHHHTLQQSLKRLLKIDKHVYMSVRSLDSHAKWPHWYCSKADNSDRRFVLCQTPLAVQISVFVSVACGLMGAEAKCRTQFDGKPWQKYCPESENGRKGPIILTHSLHVGPYDAWSLSAMNSLPRISDSRPALRLKAKYFTPEMHKASWYRMHLLVSLWP